MPRLIATQSHVVHGYVGNKAATFPLQCLGWDVDCCNTVQFSNHTGYGMDKVFGSITDHETMKKLLSGLFRNFPHDYDGLLSGYLPNKDCVEVVGSHYTNYKKSNPKSIWLMDPVMGDEGKMYVNDDVIPEYRKLALSGIVDIITPNQFELEILCGEKISSKEDLKSALKSLHQSIPVIIVTSCDAKIFDDEGFIYCVASMRDKDAIIYRIPQIQSYFTGVGDLFSALLLDRIHKLLISDKESDLKFEEQVNEVITVVQKVLHVTRSFASKATVAKMGVVEGMKEMELRIIESKDLYGFSTKVTNDSSSVCVEKYIYKKL
ncbi:hypothetical protein KAFR_0E00570 [Kazachstania africana CBS 2517]|uniref:pyridoxal kinase n=1 Tax=Kazachstania africana (strain ATCC 22294 / BCRC 22015 / CBS 2517 / CECT 1963 / NBRC 1671 / NRRL Y-8276) TaxID=1071382 RepID=H2AV11_KAZAF|nr:hypothetical protein KAFR_0E00570 [Kazachstania africana CBS 2517]CCF58211.1 hypothetical protein KAFR_0E00570 [Kazachstania africana CBS 2517]